MRGIFSPAPPNPNAKSLVFAAKYLLRAKGNLSEAIQVAAQMGALPRIQSILKSVPVAATTDGDFGSILSDTKIASDAFVESMTGSYILPTMVADGGITRVPIGKRLGYVISGSLAGIIDEGQVVPGTSFRLAGQIVPITKSQGFVVISSEVAYLETPAASALIDSELRKAVGGTVDAKFTSIAMAGAASFASSGQGDDDLTDDVEALLAAVNVAGSRLYFAMAANVANRLTVLDKRGRMSPTGGEFLGVPVVVSAAVADGTLRLFDAKGFAGDIEGIAIEGSRQATLDLGLPPDSPPTSATTMVSLWQNNLAAVKATTHFGVVKIRTAAAAEITGIANSPNSPA